MAFVRRYQSFPSQQVIGQIEGVVIVDLPPPATIQGVQTGVVAVAGEFSDMTYATLVDGSGNVTTKPQPVEVTSAQDMLDKVGGWDSTLGDFGNDDGNGFVAIRNKRFSRLVVAPVNLASSKGVRVYRELPLCVSGANANPIVILSAATVPAGTEFSTGGGVDKVKLAKSVTFTSPVPLVQALDGSQTVGGPSVLREITSASSDFVAAGVQEGDAVVIGVFGGSGNPGTYRVVTVNSATSINVQALDGSLMTWGGAAPMPFRIYPAAAFDSGADHQISEVAGYLLPARPTRVNSSSSLNGTIAAGTFMPATVAAPAQTATNYDPLTGLRLATNPVSGLAFTAAVQAPNAVSVASIDALYQSVLDALLADSAPANQVNVIVAARTSPTIRSALRAHVLQASANGIGRMACLGPGLTTVSATTATGDASPGVGATRDERVIYCWPGAKTSIPEAVGFNIKKADGTFTSDGVLDVRADAFMASILSNLAAEKNPAQTTDPVPLCLSPILGFQSGNLPAFNMSDYILFKQNGVAALRFDRASGKQFQSGITSSLVSTQKNINRRRMADEIEDSLAQAYAPLSKQVLTTQLKDVIDAQTVAYLEGLKSETNPAAQRIANYSVDSLSGNTPQLLAAGIYVVIVRVQMLATADVIVLQAEVGPSVNISTT